MRHVSRHSLPGTRFTRNAPTSGFLLRYFFSSLGRNLVAGLRTSFFLPVSRLAFRVDLAQLVALFVISALLDLLRDWLRTDSDRVFSLLGAGTELYG